jgi:hypothetical protein
MSKKIIILITIILFLFLLVFGYVYITKTKTDPTTGETAKEENFLFNIFSFGNKGNLSNPIESLVDFITGNGNEEEEIVVINKLNKISSMPISGYGILEKERYVVIPDVIENTVQEGDNITPTAPQTEFVPILKYADKTTGNIYQTLVFHIKKRHNVYMLKIQTICM